MVCPKYGIDGCQLIAETAIITKDFSDGKGCCFFVFRIHKNIGKFVAKIPIYLTAKNFHNIIKIII